MADEEDIGLKPTVPKRGLRYPPEGLVIGQSWEEKKGKDVKGKSKKKVVFAEVLDTEGEVKTRDFALEHNIKKREDNDVILPLPRDAG